jgi:gliding motility-associated-like protein
MSKFKISYVCILLLFLELKPSIVQASEFIHSESSRTEKLSKVTTFNFSEIISNVPYAVKPRAKFLVNDSTQCLRGNSFVFTDTSTTTTGSLTYSWNFGDGTTSNVKKPPTHVYKIAGTYIVRLIVTISGGGASDTTFSSVFVYPNSNANFLVNDSSQCFKKNNFKFSHTAATGVTLTYAWDFGDNKFSSNSAPVHSYTESGKYKVGLQVVSQFGCIDSAKLDIVVYGDVNSSFAIEDSTQCLTGNLFTFKNNSTYNDNVLTSKWFFGDDSITNEFNPVHTYENSGIYSVTLVSSNSAGCYDTSVVRLIVFPLPKSSFKVNKYEQQLTNNQFVFTNLTTIDFGSHSSKWDFGDFNSSGIMNPDHSYIDVGTYTVTLISISDQGCTDTFSNYIIVTTAVTAKFTSTETVSCIDENLFLFTNESTVKGGKIKYFWDFGDSTTTSIPDPSHVYKQPGVYKVKLTATGSYGGIDSSSIIITVAPLPIAGFNVNDSLQCLKGNKFAFFNTSSIEFGELNYIWNFGDSNESTLRNLKYSYKESGDFIVKLTVFSEFGCRDSAEQLVSVKPTPLGIKYDSVVTRANFDTRLVARNFDSASYVWNPNIYLSDNKSKEVIFNGPNPFKYTIRITDIYGCTFVDTLNILFFKNINILVPKAFTPNKDNLNDVLRPILLGIKEFKSFSVYNKWGIQLYNTSDAKQGWNGTYKGVLQPMDTYTWVVTGIDIDGNPISKSGNVVLLK